MRSFLFPVTSAPVLLTPHCKLLKFWLNQPDLIFGTDIPRMYRYHNFRISICQSVSENLSIWKSTISTFFHKLNASRGAVLKAFPNPLTPAEEKKYIQRYTEGDLEAKHILIERNLRLVAHVIRKYQNTSEDPEDLISIGTIGLIKAVITFDPEKGNRLAAYASRCVENEVLMYLRARKKCSHEISLYEPIGTDREGNEVNLYDIIESTETDIPERIHLKDNIQKLYEKLENELSPREKLVLKMRYGLYQGEEYTQREIAAQLGISRSYVSRIEKSAIEKLCGYF